MQNLNAQNQIKSPVFTGLNIFLRLGFRFEVLDLDSVICGDEQIT